MLHAVVRCGWVDWQDEGLSYLRLSPHSLVLVVGQ